jgi:ubiquinone/menaquinone biosynthesis C-methylase UbiE
MRLVTPDDIRDLYLKAIQRGIPFILSKLSIRGSSRTRSSFNSTEYFTSNWWVIPSIRERWNYLITGSASTTYEEYVSNEIFGGNKPLRLVSIGSGVCSHEIRLAELNPRWEVTCIDFSSKLLRRAKEVADSKGLANISFQCKDIYRYSLPDSHFDIVLFHSSLHHFRHIDEFLRGKILPALKAGGHLIINEYVGPNRLQFGKNQLKAINRCLEIIDDPHKSIPGTNLTKRRFYGPGLIRMFLADPSECVDSESILPTIHKYFETVIERPYGGNILMNVYKDIAHNFIESTTKNTLILEATFRFEDDYLLDHESDFLFGVYRKKLTK